MHKLLLLAVVIGLSGCLSPSLDELVATPADMPAGYAYWPIEEAEYFRAITNATTNPGAGTASIGERNGITPTAMYASAFEGSGEPDDIVISIAFAFASEEAVATWGAEGLCEDSAVLKEGNRVVVVLGFDASGDASVSAVTSHIIERTGAKDVCEPIKPWL